MYIFIDRKSNEAFLFSCFSTANEKLQLNLDLRNFSKKMRYFILDKYEVFQTDLIKSEKKQNSARNQINRKKFNDF